MVLQVLLLAVAGEAATMHEVLWGARLRFVSLGSRLSAHVRRGATFAEQHDWSCDVSSGLTPPGHCLCSAELRKARALFHLLLPVRATLPQFQQHEDRFGWISQMYSPAQYGPSIGIGAQEFPRTAGGLHFGRCLLCYDSWLTKPSCDWVF